MENLWITTEKLNILYHENWTRLASEEIARFQEQVVRTLTDNLGAAQNLATHTGNDDVTGKKLVNHEWNLARAFFYSLTVLTTIGESNSHTNTASNIILRLRMQSILINEKKKKKKDNKTTSKRYYHAVWSFYLRNNSYLRWI